MKKTKRLLYIFNILMIMYLIFSKNLSTCDEIYNFNFGRYIVNGYKLYNDFNCIVFPLFPYLMSIILKLFGEEIIVYRFFQIIGLLLIEFFFVKILKKLDLDKKFLSHIILCCYIILVSIFCLFEYNMLNCLFLLIIMNQELKEEKKNFDYILIGLLSGFTIITKQSIGLLIFVSSIIISMINKDRFKNIILKIFGTLIIIGLMFLYLVISNSVEAWFDYTILGIKYFKSSFDLLLYGNFFICLLIIFLMIFEVLAIIKTFKSKDKKALILLIYGFASLFVMYPIFEEHHSLIGFLPNLLIYMYLFFKGSKLTDKQLKQFSITISLGIVIIIVLNIANFIDLSNKKDFKHYKYIKIENNLKEKLNKVMDFINNNPNSYIIDIQGVFYTVPLDQFNRNI